jgi:hypothetical protein
MLKTFARVAILLALTAGAAAAQDKKPVTTADFVGTWNIEVMSHQIALVIEPQEGNKVTATMMMMGTDVPLKGELVDGTLTLTGVKPEGGVVGEHVPQGPGAKPILVRLQDDGTVAGEMMTGNGPVTWTGEKLKTKKKG